jgi:tRNA modification GTPase
MDDETIFSVASGAGRSAIAVVRLSGSQTGAILARMLGTIPLARRATYVALRNPANGECLDRCVVLWFPGPSSFTGEDCAEFHLHGGRAVISGVVAALGQLDACRPARAGEFTRRAFLNGKMDLAEVEGLADLINAETEAQRAQALRQLGGVLGRLAEGWRRRLIEALAAVEAEIDFADEGDVETGVATRAQAIAGSVAAEINAVLDDGNRGERLRDGYTVVIAGPPNSGKSTLLNALARRDVAIVSPYEGTTRDVIEVHLDLDGLPVTLVDTAGLRDTGDPIEALGIQRGRDRAACADLVLQLCACGADARLPPSMETAHPPGVAHLPVATMADLSAAAFDPAMLAVSALTGAGIDALVAEIGRWARQTLGGCDAIITRERHRRALQDAGASLRRLNESLPVELAAEELRRAANALGTLAGRISAEDVLEEIFSSFCIGK